jgi:hypothetical protein
MATSHGRSSSGPRSACRRSPAQRSRDPSTQNSLPSGSARTTHDRSPCPTSARVAPSASNRSTSASRLSGRKSRCSRFLIVFSSGTATNRSAGRRSGVGRTHRVVVDDDPPERLSSPVAERAGVACVDNRLLPFEAHGLIAERCAHAAPKRRLIAAGWLVFRSQGGPSHDHHRVGSDGDPCPGPSTRLMRRRMLRSRSLPATAAGRSRRTATTCAASSSGPLTTVSPS